MKSRSKMTVDIKNREKKGGFGVVLPSVRSLKFEEFAGDDLKYLYGLA